MKNWRRQIAETLGLPDGGSGGWGRRIALAMGSTSLTGPWMRRAAGVVGVGASPWDKALPASLEGTGGWNRRAAINGIAGGGPAPEGYTAGAVAFDGATWLLSDPLTASDSPCLSYAAWVYVPSSQLYPIREEASTFFDVDPANTECPELSPQWRGFDPVTTFTVTASNAQSITWHAPELNATLVPDAWAFYAITINCNAATGAKTLQVCVGDTVVFNGTTSTDESAGPYSMLFNGLPLGIPDTPADDTPLQCYMGDVRWNPGELLDWTNVATRRLFIDADGKPVDPAIAIAELGLPAVQLGVAPDGDPADYAINKGTDAAFTLTGTLTLAPSSPSDGPANVDYGERPVFHGERRVIFSP